MSWIATFLGLLLMSSAILAQTPGAEVNYSNLAGRSSAVVIGVVEGTQWVIHPDRRSSRTTPLPNGQQVVELQDPSQYMAGRIARLRVSEVLRGGARVKVGGVVNIFIAGSFTGENAPALADRQKYVVFLSPMRANVDEFAGTVVYQPGARPGGEPQFVPKTYYTIVGDTYGVVRVAPGNSRTIDQIRSAARRAPRS